MNNRAAIGDSNFDLLLHFIQHDFQTGATIIDPDGSLARAVADIIPPEHTQNTFYFDPSNDDQITNFNVFRKVKQKDRPRLVQDLCAFLNNAFPAGESTLTRLYSTTLLPTILTIVADNEDVSLMSVLKFMADADYQARCLERCTSAMAKDNWNAAQHWKREIRDGALALIEATLRQLLLYPVIHRTLASGNGFYPTKTRILIADLSRARLGDTVSKLLGTLLITRAKTPVYINNFDFYASDYIASLFSQGGYTVATPFLSTLPPNVAQALLGFEEKYVYRTTPEDAERLRYFVNQMNPDNLISQKAGDFLASQPIEIIPPRVRGRYRAVLRRSIALHTRKVEDA